MKSEGFPSALLFLGLILLSHHELDAQRNGSAIDSLTSTEETADFIIRFGQGGFSDHRSPVGKLGGGQFTLDVKLKSFPIAISVSTEGYTNSRNPTHSYEIADLIAINSLYMVRPFESESVILFAGGGIGGLKVPKGETEPGAMEKGILYDIEAGVNVRAFWKIGVYGIYKYLYASKEVGNVKLIDFSEHIVLLGITFNFSL